MCRDVLSDDWISHPVYVSETGFVAHKKTIYEEAMYKCEEERYEFDLNIEANLSVIALLEPISKKIQMMSPEERADFKLSPGLGGNSVAIYTRIIKKVYDNERGLEVIDALYQNPAVAVPVVLKRLKQKDEEWKRSQREWRKVWKDIDHKNFSKSLDHQGIHFKTSDRKSVNLKSLLTEIEVLQREQREKRSTLANRYQFDFVFKNSEIFKDCEDIVCSFIESNMPSSDEEKIVSLFKELVPLFFFVNNNDSADQEGATNEARPTESLPNENSMDVDENEHAATNGEAPGEDDSKNVDGATPGNRKRSTYSFYANTALYAFFRLFQMLYARLLKMKELSHELKDEIPRSETQNPTAVELGLTKGTGIDDSL